MKRRKASFLSFVYYWRKEYNKNIMYFLKDIFLNNSLKFLKFLKHTMFFRCFSYEEILLRKMCNFILSGFNLSNERILSISYQNFINIAILY